MTPLLCKPAYPKWPTMAHSDSCSRQTSFLQPLAKDKRQKVGASNQVPPPKLVGFGAESPQPFEATRLHPKGRAFFEAQRELHRSPHAQHQSGIKLVAMRDGPQTLAWKSQADKDQIGLGSVDPTHHPDGLVGSIVKTHGGALDGNLQAWVNLFKSLQQHGLLPRQAAHQFKGGCGQTLLLRFVYSCLMPSSALPFPSI